MADSSQRPNSRAVAFAGGEDAARAARRHFNGVYEVPPEVHLSAGFSEFRSSFADRVESLEDRRVLDVGCGAGRDLRFFTDRGINAAGIDISGVAIQCARDAVPDAALEVRDVTAPSWLDGHSAVWLAFTLNYLPDDLIPEVLSVIQCALPPGGLVGVVVETSESGDAQWMNSPGDMARSMFVSRPTVQHFSAWAAASGLELTGDGVVEWVERGVPVAAWIATRPSTASADAASVLLEQTEDLAKWVNQVRSLGSPNTDVRLSLCEAYRDLAEAALRAEDRVSYADRLHTQLCAVYLLLERNPSPTSEQLSRAGVFLQATSQYGRAARCFERITERDPDDAGAFLRLGYCYEGDYRFDKAVAAAEQCLTLAGEGKAERHETVDVVHALGHFHAEAAFMQGTVDEVEFLRGVQYMVHAIERDPDGLAYVSCLGLMYSDRGQFSQALIWYDWARQLLPPEPDPDVDFELKFYEALAHLGAGDVTEASRLLDEFESHVRTTTQEDDVAHVVLYRARLELRKTLDGSENATSVPTILQSLYAAPMSRLVPARTRQERWALIGLLEAMAVADVHETANDALSAIGACEAAAALLRDVVLDAESEVEPFRPTVPMIIVVGASTADLAHIPAGTATVVTSDEVGLDDHEARIYVVGSALLNDFERRSDLAYRLGSLRSSGTLSIGVGGDETVEPLLTACTSTLEQAVRLANWAALYTAVLGYFAYIRSPIGLAPISGAPSRLTAQTAVAE